MAGRTKRGAGPGKREEHGLTPGSGSAGKKAQGPRGHRKEPAIRDEKTCRAKQALPESDLRFQGLVDSGQALIWTSRPDKQCDYFNLPWLKFRGRSLEQELGDGWLEGVHPDDLETCIERFRTAFDRRERFSIEYRLRRHDGEFRWIQDDGTPRFDEQGKFLGYIGHCLDITDRKRAEEKNESLLAAVQKERTNLSTLIDSIADEVWFADPEGRFTLANPAALREFALDPERLADVETLAKSLQVFRPDGSPRPVEEAPPLRALAGEVVRNQEELVRTAAGPGLRHRQVSAAPVRDRSGRIIGAVAVVRDITEIKKAEAARQQSEARFRELFDFMSSGVAIYEAVDDGADFIFRDLNPAAEKIERVRREDILGKRVTGAFPGVKALGIFAVFQRVWRTGTLEHFPAHLYKDERDPGSWRENWVFKLPTGEIVAVYNDITERIRAEEAMRETNRDLELSRAAAMDLSGALRAENETRKKIEEGLREAEARYRLLFEHSPDGIVILDPETARPLEFNETACRQLGYSREEFARLAVTDYEAAETPEETFSRIASVLREGRNDFETRHRTKQGDIRDIHVTAQITEILGHPVYHCVWRDITERKRAEERLRDSEENMRYIVKHDPNAVAVYDRELRYIAVSDRYLRDYEIKEADIIGKRHYDVFPEMPKKVAGGASTLSGRRDRA